MGFDPFQVIGRLLAAAMLVALATPATAACQMRQVAELQTLGDVASPRITVEVNGHPTPFVLDTGAEQTLILTRSAASLGVRALDGWNGRRSYGAGGETAIHEAVLDSLGLAGAQVRGVRVMVAGEREIGNASGLLGWDILSHWDVEFDLAHHAVRLFSPQGCHGDEVAYWAQSYSKAPMSPGFDGGLKIMTTATLNGRRVDAQLDSGAGETVITPSAVARAGARPDTAVYGVTNGVGAADIPVQVADFQSFGLGGETIQHPRIVVADLFSRDTYTQTGSMLAHSEENLPDMLLGADLLHAHRLLVATDQNTLYFTYTGGRVFQAPDPAAKP